MKTIEAPGRTGGLAARIVRVPLAAMTAAGIALFIGMPTYGCMPIAAPTIQFGFRSAELDDRALVEIRRVAGLFKEEDPRCMAFSIAGSMDAAEAGAGSKLDMQRAEAVLTALLNEGLVARDMKHTTASASLEVGSRSVKIWWSRPPDIRRECEPQKGPMPACGWRCWAVLADGTRCGPIW